MDPAALFRLCAALFLLVFAIAAWLGPPRRGAPLVFLTVFLLAAAIELTLPEGYDRLHPLVSVTGAAALFHFVARRSDARRGVGIGIAWGASALLGGAFAVAPAGSVLDDVTRTALLVDVGALGFLSFWSAIRQHEASPRSASARLLAIATALGALPNLHLVGGWLNVLANEAGLLPLWVGDVLLVYAPLSLLALALAFRRTTSLARMLPALGLALGVLLHTSFAELRHGASPLPAALTLPFAAIVLPGRWLAFSAFASAALLRPEGDERTGRLAGRLLVAGGALLAGVLLVGSWRAWTGDQTRLTVLEWALLVTLVVLSQGFRRAVDAIASRVYGWTPTPTPREGDPLRTGEIVASRYRVGALLGRGGAGRVVLARDAQLGREVALKELPAGLLAEAQALARVQHPNVLVVHDVLALPTTTLLVTEYAKGGSLAARLREGRLTASEAHRVLREALAGLEAIHAAGMVHGDVKPANLLFAGDGAVKVADLGASRLPGAATVPLVATPGYLAPEQLQGSSPTVETDLYQIALVAREMSPEPTPPRIARVTEQALKADPKDRYHSARAMHEALEGEGMATSDREGASDRAR